MTAIYSVVAEPARDLVRITLTGLFDERSIADFVRARHQAHAGLRCGPNRHLTLCDTRTISIQRQDLVARWGAVLADPAYLSRRIAFVAASTLARAQLHRAMGAREQHGARVFLDPVEAEGWLFAADEEQAA